MTAGGPGTPLPIGFSRYPGAVLQLSRNGRILRTNGRLERDTGQELIGRSFAGILDPTSSAAKWARILAETPLSPGNERADGEGDGGAADVLWELILKGTDTLAEPRSFAVLWDHEAELIWIFEHRLDPRLDDLRDRVTGVNSELTSTQRELLKEQGRLGGALDELEELYRTSTRLTRKVQEQNETLELQNEKLLILSEELKSRGAELERSNAALDEFAHVVSHDLKSPLRAIGNFACWLEEDLGEHVGGDARSHLADLRRSVDRMREMIEGVLDYARAGRAHGQAQSVDVGAMVEEVLQMLQPPRELEVRVGDLPKLMTPRAPLQQIWMNLISNALRYAPAEGGIVEIAGLEDGDFHRFSVTDNGPGVPERMQVRIWSLFETQGDSTAGTGIGLAVVKKLVEARRGSVGLDSTPDHGSTFHFTWPKAPLDPRA